MPRARSRLVQLGRRPRQQCQGLRQCSQQRRLGRQSGRWAPRTSRRLSSGRLWRQRGSRRKQRLSRHQEQHSY